MNRPVTVAATLTVRVPLGASGSLADGARRVVARTDAVDAVVDVAISAIEPGLNDTVVGCRVRFDVVDFVADSETTLERRLEAGVGVLDVETVDSVGGDPPVVEAEPARPD